MSYFQKEKTKKYQLKNTVGDLVYMDFSIQILKTGGLITLTAGTVAGLMLGFNKAENLIRPIDNFPTICKEKETETETETEKEKEEILYEYKYVEEYQKHYNELKEEDTTNDSDNVDIDEEAYAKQLDEKLNNTKIHEITPNGDVIMYYDVDLESFVYYCNDRQIPYKYLETVARKYALDNNCLEIYINMYEEIKRGIKRQTEAKIKNCLDKSNKVDKNKQAVNNVFATFKQYNQTNPKEIIKQRKYITKENANRYSYRGNIEEGEKLRIEDAMKLEEKKTATHNYLTLDSISNEIQEIGKKKSDQQPKKITFTEFKKLQQTTNIDSLPVKTIEDWIESDGENNKNSKDNDNDIDSLTFSPVQHNMKKTLLPLASNHDNELTLNESNLTYLLDGN